MLKNSCHRVSHSHRGFLMKACLLLAFAALPAVAIESSTVKLSLNANFNGYTVKRSANGTSVTCVGVHAGTSQSSPLLNGDYQVTIVLANKEQLTKTLTFKDGLGVFGAIGPIDLKVNTVTVIVPEM